MKKIIKISLSACLIFLYSGCGDEFMNRFDETSINSGSFYNTETDAIASVNAAYAALQNISLWGRRIHFLLDFSSDEIGPTPNTQGPPLELLLHTFGPQGNEHIITPWQMFYRQIAKSNIAIENVSGMNIDENVKKVVIAQAKFLRGLSYFYIASLWNGGPLRTEENNEEIHTPRASGEDVWRQVENDLTAAVPDLPWTWDAANAGRATRGAAKSLLGKAYLFQGKYAEAETQLMDVINNGPYYLIGGDDDPSGAATTIEGAIAAMRSNHAFGVKNNGEAVFEVQFKSGEGGFGWDSNSERGRLESTIRPREYGVDGNAFYNAKPSDKLIAAYEGNGGTGIGDRDPRMEAFFFTQNSMFRGEPYLSIFQNSGYAWKKYQDEDNPAVDDNDCNHNVIRYADVILMAAEAKIFQSKVSEGIALINRIRRRADPTGNILPDRPLGSTQPEAIDFLVHERQVELCGEQVRRMDLVRWGIANEHINNFQVGKHEYFPIPQNELDANREISNNNPGYN